jgi:hypothetical protein
LKRSFSDLLVLLSRNINRGWIKVFGVPTPFSRNQKTYSIFFIFALAMSLVFQNCGGQFDAVSAPSTLSTLSSTGITPSPGGPPLPVSADQQNRATCAANFNAPNLSTLNPSAVTITSGLGKLSGDSVIVPGFATTASMNIKDLSVQSSANCATYTQMRSQCAVVVDASHPANFTQAIGLTGDSLLSMAVDDKGKMALANLAVTMKGCDNIDLSKGAVNLAVSLNRGTNQARCVQGSFYLEIYAEQDVDVAKKASSSQFVKVNLVNGCWNESRLKNGTQDYPRLAGLGTASAIDGNWAAVVAPGENMGTVLNAGSVHVFNFDGTNWNHHSILQASDAQTDDNMSAVVIKGNTLIASSAYRLGHGGVFVYKLNGNVWTLSQVIDPPDSQADQLFGFSLAFDGTNLAVGSPQYSRSAGDEAGIVTMYSNSSGSMAYRQTLQVSDANFAYKGFGMSLSMDGNLLAVGAPQAISKESLGKGEVRIFQNSGTWTQVALKTPGSELSSNNALRYGASVALSGGQLLVGATGHDAGSGNTNAGAAVYYASYSGGVTKALPGQELDGVYGTSVAFGSSGLFIGGPYCDSRTGFVDYFTAANLSKVAYRMISTNRTANDGFGWSVAVSGNQVITGARIKNDPQQSSGAAYIYQMK